MVASNKHCRKSLICVICFDFFPQTLWDRTHWKALFGRLFRSCRQPSIPWNICVASSTCVSRYTRSRWAERKPQWWSKITVVCTGYCIILFIFDVSIVFFFVLLNSDLQIKLPDQNLAWVLLPKRKWEAGKREKPSSFSFPSPPPPPPLTPKEDLILRILSLYLLTSGYGLFMLKGRKRLEKSSSFKVQS